MQRKGSFPRHYLEIDSSSNNLTSSVVRAPTKYRQTTLELSKGMVTLSNRENKQLLLVIGWNVGVARKESPGPGVKPAPHPLHESCHHFFSLDWFHEILEHLSQWAWRKIINVILGKVSVCSKPPKQRVTTMGVAQKGGGKNFFLKSDWSKMSEW
jgi:hypothetical protein